MGWIEPLASQALSTISQSFFAWRCYKLNNRNKPILFTLIASEYPPPNDVALLGGLTMDAPRFMPTTK